MLVFHMLNKVCYNYENKTKKVYIRGTFANNFLVMKDKNVRHHGQINQLIQYID